MEFFRDTNIDFMGARRLWVGLSAVLVVGSMFGLFVHKLFFQLRDEFKKTLVIVTHDMNLAEMADRMIRMKDGRIV